MQLVRFNIQHRCKTAARLIHLGAAKLRCRVIAIGLDLALGVEAMQPVDHLPARVGPARIFKKRMALKAGLGKGRKLGPHEIGIEGCHMSLLLRR